MFWVNVPQTPSLMRALDRIPNFLCAKNSKNMKHFDMLWLDEWVPNADASIKKVVSSIMVNGLKWSKCPICVYACLRMRALDTLSRLTYDLCIYWELRPLPTDMERNEDVCSECLRAA